LFKVYTQKYKKVWLIAMYNNRLVYTNDMEKCNFCGKEYEHYWTHLVGEFLDQ